MSPQDRHSLRLQEDSRKVITRVLVETGLLGWLDLWVSKARPLAVLVPD